MHPHSNDSKQAWQAGLRTGYGLCPATGAKGNWSYKADDSSQNPSFVIYYGSASLLGGWREIGEASSGGRILIRDGEADRPAFSKTSLPYYQASRVEAERARPEHRDLIYRALLSFLPCQDRHRKRMERRGFHRADYPDVRLGYLPGNRGRAGLVRRFCEAYEIREDELYGVPGFFINHNGAWSLAGPQGLLLPSYDEHGRIQALQIRPERPRAGAKYIWLSSAHKVLSGISSGSPAGVLMPLDAQGKPLSLEKDEIDTHELLLTEGFHKGLALRKAFDKTVAWLAGAGNLGAALALVGRLQPRRVTLFLDADWRSNFQVRRQMARLLQALSAQGIEVRCMAWPSHFGKGIDDALYRGKMALSELEEIPQARLLRSLEGFKSNRLSFDPKKTPLRWEPQQQPSLIEVRNAIREALCKAFGLPPGTIALMMGSTNGGKSYTTKRHVPGRSVLVYGNYKPLHEALEDLQVLGRDVGVYWGRQQEPGALAPDATEQAQQDHERRSLRFQEAGCLRYDEAQKAGGAGHNPCEGCAFFQHHQTPLLNDTEKSCRYWPAREKIEKNPPELLLMNIQSFLARPDLLKDYDRVIFDDIEHFVYELMGKTVISRDHILDWFEHPSNEETPEELLTFFKELSDAFNHQDGWTEEKLLEKARAALPAARSHLKERKAEKKGSMLACEESFVREHKTIYPQRLVCKLLEHVAAGGDYKLDRHELRFAQPNKRLLDTLREKTLISLNATEDVKLWRWFSKAFGFELVVPELPRRFARMIQICDKLFSRDQLESHQEVIQKIIDKMGPESSAIFSFKPREGEEPLFSQVGHFGRDDRGLNEYKDGDYKRLLALGHFQISTTDAEELAWLVRSGAEQLGARPPTFRHQEKEDPEHKGHALRAYQDPMRPTTRRCWRHEDPLVEHIRRHQHSSVMVQTSARLRDEEKPVFIATGEPLDGLAYEVPVELITLRELAEEWGVAYLEERRRLPEALRQRNEQEHQRFLQRIEDGVPLVEEFIQGHYRHPNISETRKLLAMGESKRASVKLARAVLERCSGIEPPDPWALSCPSNLEGKGLEHQEGKVVGGKIESRWNPRDLLGRKECGVDTPNLSGPDVEEMVAAVGLKGGQREDKEPPGEGVAPPGSLPSSAQSKKVGLTPLQTGEGPQGESREGPSPFCAKLLRLYEQENPYTVEPPEEDPDE